MAKIVPLLLLLSQSLVDAKLYSSYVTLSFELIGFPAFGGSKSSPNTYSKNLIDNLAQAQGSPLVLRVGGNSADRQIFDASLTTPTANSCKSADPGAWQCIGPSFFESYANFPAGTKFSHNFNLATQNASGFNTLEATVPLACNALRGKLEVWEMGNEPDLYTPNRRTAPYSPAQYVTEWLDATKRFEGFLRKACPDMADNVKYMFPSVASPGSKIPIDEIYAKLGNNANRVTQKSVHNYMAGATAPGVTLQGTLMNHTAVANSIRKHVDYAKRVSSAPGGYILGEHNSLFGGGALGLSDVFGSGLWAMDFSLTAASTDVIKRIHFHQAVNSPYAAWQPTGTLQTKPPYYGKLAAATFLGKSQDVSVMTLALGGDKHVDSGYGAFVNNKLQRIAILNLREYDSNSGSTRTSKKYTVKVTPRSTWTVMKLTAGGARDQTGITFNGFAYDADTQGKAKRITSRASGTKIQADHLGNLVVDVAASEAVVLQIN